MSLKLEATNESSPVKGTKAKKRISKARRSTRSGLKRKESTTNKLFENKDTNTSSINTSDFGENYSYEKYALTPYNGRISVNGSMSEMLVGGRDRLSKSDSSIKLDTYCQYQCSCKAVKKCKEKMDFKLLTRNATPIRMTYQKPAGEKTSDRSNNINRKTPSELSITRKRSVYDNLNSLKSQQGSTQKSHKTYQNCPLNTERRNSNSSSSSRNSTCNAKRKIPPPQRNLPCRSQCCDCYSFSPFKICKHIQICKCNCNIPCEKISSGSLRSPRNSFCSSQSCPQLDVIKEEDTESEDLQSKCSSIEMPKKSEPRSKSLAKGKKQKTLEDSCADFLSIICDNILESVQKSVDKKVIELNSESKEKFDELSKKLDENEIRMKDCYQEMMEKMTEQNNSYFQKIYSLIQISLMETKAANQYRETKKSYQDNHSQYENVVNEAKEHGNNVITEKFKDGVDNEKNSRMNKFIGCGCCKCVIFDDENTSRKFNQSNNSYPNNKLREAMSPPSLDENQYMLNVPLNGLNTGNLMADLSNMAEILKESLKELKAQKSASPMGSNIEIHENIDLNTKFPLLNDNSNHNFRKESREEDLNIMQSFPVKNVVDTNIPPESMLQKSVLTPHNGTTSESITQKPVLTPHNGTPFESILQKSVLTPHNGTPTESILQKSVLTPLNGTPSESITQKPVLTPHNGTPAESMLQKSVLTPRNGTPTESMPQKPGAHNGTLSGSITPKSVLTPRNGTPTESMPQKPGAHNGTPSGSITPKSVLTPRNGTPTESMLQKPGAHNETPSESMLQKSVLTPHNEIPSESMLQKSVLTPHNGTPSESMPQKSVLTPHNEIPSESMPQKSSELMPQKSLLTAHNEISSESTIQRFVLTPTNSNSFTIYKENTSRNSNKSINSNNSAQLTKFPINEDNNDTSGYTTEPEDNNDIDNANSGRKKLQKRASKQPTIFPPVTLRVVRKSDSRYSS